MINKIYIIKLNFPQQKEHFYIRKCSFLLGELVIYFKIENPPSMLQIDKLPLVNRSLAT